MLFVSSISRPAYYYFVCIELKLYEFVKLIFIYITLGTLKIILILVKHLDTYDE